MEEKFGCPVTGGGLLNREKRPAVCPAHCGVPFRNAALYAQKALGGLPGWPGCPPPAAGLGDRVGVFADVHAGPVGAEHEFAGQPGQVGKIGQQLLRRQAATSMYTFLCSRATVKASRYQQSRPPWHMTIFSSGNPPRYRRKRWGCHTSAAALEYKQSVWNITGDPLLGRLCTVGTSWGRWGRRNYRWGTASHPGSPPPPAAAAGRAYLFLPTGSKVQKGSSWGVPCSPPSGCPPHR